MNTKTRNRRLVGHIWRCGDDECECIQPVIDEVWEQRCEIAGAVVWEGRTERVWEGTWMAEPSRFDLDELRDELTGACERHKLERDGWDSDRWEREL